MIIDAHAHCFAFERRIACNMNGAYFLTAAELIKYMDTKGIDKAVIQPINGSETLVEPQSIGELLHICDMYPGRFFTFASIDPRQPLPDHKITVSHFAKLLDGYKQFGCRGLGEFIARLPWNDFRVERLLQACGKTEMPVVFHTTTADTGCYGLLDYIGLPLLEEAVAKFSDTVFIGHSPAFWSEISGDVDPNKKNMYPKGQIKEGGAVVRLLRRYPNLCCDISAGSGYNAISRDPEFSFEFIEEFQDRLLFGQDVCSKHQIPGMRHIELLGDWLEKEKISRNAYEKIMWKNANRLLKLGL